MMRLLKLSCFCASSATKLFSHKNDEILDIIEAEKLGFAPLKLNEQLRSY